MAEQDTHGHTGDVREGETQPTNTDHVSASGELKQEETDSALNVKSTEDSASSSASTDTETKTNDGEDMEQAEIKNGDSAEENPLAEGSSPSEASTLTLEDKCTPPQADDGSHGDHNKPTPRNEQPTVIEEIPSEYHTEEKREPKTSTPSPLDDRQGDQVGEPIGRLNEESTGTNNTDSEAEKDDVRGLYKQEYTTPPKTVLNQEISNEEKMDEQTENVETIHPTAKETIVSTNPVAAGGSRYLIAVGIVAVVALLVQQLLQLESPPQEKDVRQIDIFLSQMEKLKTQFPNQRAELWKRSRVHLLRHLQTTQPTEPVSLILTAGVKAEKTLHCLAQALASAFSSPLNASVLHIDGASKASQDSDQVKLEIDSKLQGAFEGDKPVAVIHRFEELPPGSTLIFYRYCDHENAAYKKTCLIFTVLLGEEEEIPAKSGLSTVEEMVDDHLQKKFLSDSHPVSFDRMDLDKYGGLWSRISHLILPVTAEEGIEQEGC